MIDIEEAIGIAKQNGGIGTITGKHNAPIAHVVTERRMRHLLGQMPDRPEEKQKVAPSRQKPTRGERRARARRRELHATDVERSRKANITRQDNANRDRNRQKKAGVVSGMFARDLVGTADLQRQMNSGRSTRILTRRG